MSRKKILKYIGYYLNKLYYFRKIHINYSITHFKGQIGKRLIG